MTLLVASVLTSALLAGTVSLTSANEAVAKAFHDVGLSSLRQRASKAAREALSEARRLHPSSGHTLLLRGHVALMLDRDPEEAEDLYEQAELELGDASVEVMHAFARLFRMQDRWEEADERYTEAVALSPADAGLREEQMFARGKRVIASGDVAAAVTAFEAGLKLATPSWKPHFARELAHGYGLAGDVTSAVEAYGVALDLGGIPDEGKIGDVLSTLAIHHERVHDLATAKGFLHGARKAFSSVARGAEVPAEGRAHAQLSLGRISEGLYALAGPRGDSDHHAPDLPPATAMDPLPAGLHGAAAHYEAAIALQPTLAAAYDGLAMLLTGTSALSNFGAPSAAALNAEHAAALLDTAARLSVRPGVGAAATEADERRARQREAIASTAREVEAWGAVLRTRDGGDATAASPSPFPESPSAGPAWGGSDAMRHAKEVRRVDAADAPALMRLVSEGRPVVIRNLQQDAGFAPSEAWSAAALTGLVGNRTVKVSISQSGRFDGAEDGRLWGLPGSTEVLVRPPETHMALADLLSLLRDRPRGAHFYLEYNALHQYLGEPLRQMAPRPPQSSELQPLLTNLWLGVGATTSPLHYDEYENLLAQVRGNKELLLFPPEDISRLRYTARPKGTLTYEWPDKFTREPIDDEAMDTPVVFAGSINMSHPSDVERTALGRCSPLRCVLQPGETLLLPAYWHHEVYSHPAAVEDGAEEACAPTPGPGLNVAVNFWFRNESAPPPSYP